jgi:hypothetical protein
MNIQLSVWTIFYSIEKYILYFIVHSVFNTYEDVFIHKIKKYKDSW